MTPQQQPVEIDVTPTEAVVEFGSGPDESRAGRRGRWDLSGTGRELLADRRTVPMAAALAALAALVSALSEWQVTTLNAAALRDDGQGTRVLSSSLDDLGALGVGYVIGVFLIVPSMVLTLFGPPATRRHFRLAGLSVAGTLFGLLLAAAARLTSESYAVDPLYRVALDDIQMTLVYGRGLWCAFAAVLLALAALYLAGRHLPGDAVTGAEPRTEEPAAEPEAVWSWRRPSTVRDEQPDGGALDLTVSPSQPFTSFRDDRDHPN